jgi:hypothetical protein
MATVLDKEQVEAQNIFPHYFERLKQMESSITSILSSISSSKPFDLLYLNKRLWQFQTLCKMELEHHTLNQHCPMN